MKRARIAVSFFLSRGPAPPTATPRRPRRNCPSARTSPRRDCGARPRSATSRPSPRSPTTPARTTTSRSRWRPTAISRARSPNTSGRSSSSPTTTTSGATMRASPSSTPPTRRRRGRPPVHRRVRTVAAPPRRALASCSPSRAAVLVATPAWAGVDQVHLRLPLKPKLPLRGNERIALAPFILVTEADKARDKRLANVDLQAEFHRFLKKQLEKKTKFEVIETPRRRQAAHPEPDRARQGPGVLGLRRRLDDGRDHRVGQPRVQGRGPLRVQERGVRLPHRRPHLLPAGVRRADRLPVRHRLPGPRRPHRREAAAGRVQGLPPGQQAQRRRAPGTLREPLLAREPDPEHFRRPRSRGRTLHLHGYYAPNPHP